MPETTKTGDRGTTAIKNGRVLKNDPIIEALGNIDECSSLIIHMQAELGLDKEPWAKIVRELYEIAGYVSRYQNEIDLDAAIKRLEETIEAKQGHYANFIYPFDDRRASFLHYVRTVVRRTERSLVTVHETQAIDAQVFQYINRLSDYIFVQELV